VLFEERDLTIMVTGIRRCLNVTSLVAVIALFVMSGGGGAYAAKGPSSSGKTVLSGSGGAGAGAGGLTVSFPGALTATPAFVPASLALTRVYQSSFGSFPASGDPQALTVDQSIGDVYAVSPGAGTVSRFTSAGAPENFTAGPDAGTNALTGFSFDGLSAAEVAIAPAGAVGGTAGDIYVASFAGIDVYANDGTHLGQITEANGSGFSEACGVATDNTGRLYVGDFGGAIDRYVPSASPVTNTDYDAQIAGASRPCNVAADSTGAVYASTWSSGPLTKYTASDFGTSNSGTVIDASSRAVSVDPSTDDVYVDEGNKISVFDSTGTSLYTFGSSTDFGSESAGVAVKGSGGNAYVADRSNNQIDVYGPSVPVPPSATTGSASEIHHVKATLNGHLDPNGGAEISDCHFDWGTTNTYGNTASCLQGNTFMQAADVSATITGLEPGKTYHYRLSVTNTAGSATGADQTLETIAVPIVHELTSSFGSSGSGDAQLSGNTGLAVNQATGDVYVADTANHRIEKFDASGTFISAFGWGVKDGKTEAQTCTTGCQAGSSGAGAGQLATPTFIAIDSSGGPSAGDVYVGDTTNNTVSKFDANGNYLSTNDGAASGTPFGQLAGIAVGTKGDLWVQSANADMREFTQDDTFIIKWNSGLGLVSPGMTIDSGDTLYIVYVNPAVLRLSSSGTDLGNVTGYPSFPTFNGPTTGLSIDSATGDLYVDDGGTSIRQYANPATCVPHGNQGLEGCTITETFGSGHLNAANGVAVKGSSGRVYVSDSDSVKVFDPVTPPDVATGTASAPSATSATLTGTVGPNGVALTDCHFEYVSDAAFLATGFTDLSSGGTAPCSPSPGSISPDLEDHTVAATVTGLDPIVIYHYRLIAANAQATSTGSEAVVSGPPLVETTGSPTRTATTARLDSRLDPRDAPTNYHFEYGDQGPCDSSPCTATPAQAAGNGETFELVSQQLTGLKANTTYHYRVVADNGIPGGVAYGNDSSLTTWASDAPLTHGHFPGPPGSDRAWEQVSIPDTGGSPVNNSLAISDSGERAVYAINGGSPGSQYGGGFAGDNDQYAERTSSGWENKSLYPARAQVTGNVWLHPFGRSDLSQLYAINTDNTSIAVEIWRMSPGAPAQRAIKLPYSQYPFGPDFTVSSADGSRILSVLQGNSDPAHPVGPEDQNLYDVTDGTPHMVGLLPDGSIPSCGVFILYLNQGSPAQALGWVTPDGSHAFFKSCSGPTASPDGLFVRDLINSTTVQVAAHATFIRSTAGAAFFTTDESLAAGDTGGTDIYRYTIQDGSLDCLTCVTAAAGAVVGSVGISDDGTRVYFRSVRRLLAGAAEEGIYRIDVHGDSLAYVAPSEGANVSGSSVEGNAISPDGSVFIFQSSNPALDAVNGARNGGTLQDYRYDDTDRSLVCVSCPGDGSLPRAPMFPGVEGPPDGAPGSALTSSGDLVFATPTPLVSADQNTALPSQNPTVGQDVYEWRDGRLLLVTDGQTLNVEPPRVEGASRSGRDVFFIQAARLTPDALDAQERLYDARIGGGFDFPQPPAPCSLEACQGNPSLPPNDQTPGSESFSGPGNQANSQAPAKQCGNGRCVKSQPHKRCVKGKVLKHGKCVKKKSRHKRAERVNHNQRGAK
jgi:DNA-binding beta-propeller fold protein YncE